MVPLRVTLQLDRETPVSLYRRMPDRAIFLLESAALGEATGRYSFIGLDRRWRLTTRDATTIVEGPTERESGSLRSSSSVDSRELPNVRSANFPTSSAAPLDL